MRRRAFLGSGLAAGALFASTASGRAEEPAPRATGCLGLIVERASGSVVLIDNVRRAALGRIEGLGDLSHATAVFAPCERYAYVFGRDGGLTKLDLLESRIEKRLLQSGNSIGGARSDDGRLIAVANYTPGGVNVFDAETLAQTASIPALGADGNASKTVGIVALPGRRFIFSLYDAGEIWIADFGDGATPKLTKFANVGRLPYDGNVTSDARHYLAGLFGEDGFAHIDLWAPELKCERVAQNYFGGQQRLPVYKMPHLEGWGQSAGELLLPACGAHEVLAIDLQTMGLKKRIPTHGQPVFCVARPDGREVWVNFAHPLNDTVQIIDVPALEVVHSFTPGPGVMHLEFTPRGNEIWISARDADRVVVMDVRRREKIAEIAAQKPSGILFASRAHRLGG
jgi:protein NirF